MSNGRSYISISPEQIRAGRALLNWNQKVLAHHAQISLNALNNIERDVANPKAETLERIKKALEKSGVEFLDAKGVRLRGEVLNIEKLEGAEALTAFYADFLKAFPSGPGEILYNGIDNARFHHKDPARLGTYKAVEKELWRRNIGERLLFQEGDVNFLSERNVYRWLPKDMFSQVPYTIYGDNVSFFLWGPPERLVIIRNAAIAETFRRQFEALWNIAKPVPDEIHQFYYTKDERVALPHPIEDAA